MMEAWRRSFNATVGCYHPNIWKFISALKLEQGLVEVRQAKYLAGYQQVKRKAKQDNERALCHLIGSYPERPRMKFLRGIAQHFIIGIWN